MSDTPRTDMFCRTVDHTAIVGGKIYQATIETVDASLARQLERELAEARAEIESKQYTITCASEENQQLKESLAEARAVIKQQKKTFIAAMDNSRKLSSSELAIAERLKRESSLELIESERAANAILTDEIERKDKLIEQMKDALQRLRDEEKPTTYHDCIDDGVGECAWCQAMAALSAAERGE